MTFPVLMNMTLISLIFADYAIAEVARTASHVTRGNDALVMGWVWQDAHQ